MILDSNVIIYSIQPAYEKLQHYLLSQVRNLHILDITKLEVVGFPRLEAIDKAYFDDFLAL